MKRMPLLLFMILAGCSESREELWRLPSPDKVADAVLIRGNVGALASFSYSLYIVKAGENAPEPGKGYEVFTAEHIVNLSLAWIGPRVLEIQYDKARIFHFENLTSLRDTGSVPWYVVEIRETPRTKPPSTLARDRWNGLDSQDGAESETEETGPELSRH